MRIRSFCVIAVLMFASSLALSAQTTYYLALGDSLAVGLQPSPTGDRPTNQGYVDDLYSAFRTRIPGLGLKKLGCSGETVETMIAGGKCTYAAGSQLKAAVAFLKTHPVKFVTIDIGGDDVDRCISTRGIDSNCLSSGLNAVKTNLPVILAALRAAAPHTLIVGMNYYDPFLAAWLLGSAGKAIASASLSATLTFNSLLQAAYQAFSMPVANVARAYLITDTNLLPVLNIPVNVFVTLLYTWMGAPPPLGPDIHPNAAGYAAIAVAFGQKIVF
jgi:lysophospholipase L1-like esterase